MEPLEPIVPHHSDPSPVAALHRVTPAQREGNGGSGQRGGQRRRARSGDEDAVELAIDGLAADEPAQSVITTSAADEIPRPHIDLTA